MPLLLFVDSSWACALIVADAKALSSTVQNITLRDKNKLFMLEISRRTTNSRHKKNVKGNMFQNVVLLRVSLKLTKSTERCGDHPTDADQGTEYGTGLRLGVEIAQTHHKGRPEGAQAWSMKNKYITFQIRH